MASFLSKFAGGAAKQGGALLADVASQKMRAELQTKRDQVLEENRNTLELSRREYEGSKTKASQAFTLERDAANQKAALERDAANQKAGLKRDAVKGGVKSAAESKANSAAVNTVYKSLIEDQKNSMDPKSIENPKSMKELYAEAVDIVRSSVGDGGKPKVISGSGGGGFSEDVKESDVNPSEKRFVNDKGEQAIKRGDKWHRIILGPSKGTLEPDIENSPNPVAGPSSPTKDAYNLQKQLSTGYKYGR